MSVSLELVKIKNDHHRFSILTGEGNRISIEGSYSFVFDIAGEFKECPIILGLIAQGLEVLSADDIERILASAKEAA